MVRHHPGSPRLPRPSPASRERRATLTLGWKRSKAGASFCYLGMGQCVAILPFRRSVHPLCTGPNLNAFHSKARSSAPLTGQDLLRRDVGTTCRNLPLVKAPSKHLDTPLVVQLGRRGCLPQDTYSEGRKSVFPSYRRMRYTIPWLNRAEKTRLPDG